MPPTAQQPQPAARLTEAGRPQRLKAKLDFTASADEERAGTASHWLAPPISAPEEAAAHAADEDPFDAARRALAGFPGLAAADPEPAPHLSAPEAEGRAGKSARELITLVLCLALSAAIGTWDYLRLVDRQLLPSPPALRDMIAARLHRPAPATAALPAATAIPKRRRSPRPTRRRSSRNRQFRLTRPTRHPLRRHRRTRRDLSPRPPLSIPSRRTCRSRRRQWRKAGCSCNSAPIGRPKTPSAIARIFPRSRASRWSGAGTTVVGSSAARPWRRVAARLPRSSRRRGRRGAFGRSWCPTIRRALASTRSKQPRRYTEY